MKRGPSRTRPDMCIIIAARRSGRPATSWTPPPSAQVGCPRQRNPLHVPYDHRADGAPTHPTINSDGVGENDYIHPVKPSGEWNLVRVDFTPCCYEMVDEDGNNEADLDVAGEPMYVKKRNAYITSHVNGTQMFSGALETGTRIWTNKEGESPEREAYTLGKATRTYDQSGRHVEDLQLMGHWGSTVKFRNPVIYPK